MVFLSELTTEEARELYTDSEVAILPVGSIEQHGPALPVDTDRQRAEAVSGAVTDREDVLTLPTIPVGVSDHHRHFPGTLSVGPEVLEEYISDIVESVSKHGIRKVIVVNGHGGNASAIERAARRLRADRIAFVVPWFDFDSDDVLEVQEKWFDLPVDHAGAAETSVMLHLDPDRVDESTLADAEKGGEHSGSWGRSIHGGTVGFDTIDFTSSGATGTPTEASAKAGEELLEAARDELDELLEWLVAQDLDTLWPRECD